MNLSPRWLKVLGDSGIEAVHRSNVGALNAPDTESMAYAKANNFVVLTHDLDFGAILAATHEDNPVSCKFALTMSVSALSPTT